ncbi:hypothetical protein ACIOEZ_34490 [Streptomyces sp. NPDC087866]|uniref:hypothetical protein n=1 Tax=Streptomyces sp. NPDC087866 TaxID=3365815 RepID=UPI003813537E
MTTESPRGARATAIPLPEARRIKRAIDSLGTGISVNQPPGTRHPMGERGVAAQYLGILKALVDQMETGLRGGELQTDVQKGWFNTHERDVSAILCAEADRARNLTEFSAQGITQLPRASQQLSATAIAFQVAEHGLAAAAEIAVGLDSPQFDGEAVARETDTMYEAADLLTKYVADKRAQFGEA